MSLLAANLGFMVARDLGTFSHAVQGGNPTGRRQQKPTNAQTDAPRPPSFVPLLLGWDLEEAAAYCASNQQGKAKDWIVEHWCGVKRTDVVSAFSALATAALTLCLFAVGTLQFWVLRTQAKIMDRQARSDRPFLFFHLVSGIEEKRGEGMSRRSAYIYRFKFVNYGKSPAILTRIEAEVLEGDNLAVRRGNYMREDFSGHPVIAPESASAECERMHALMDAEEVRRPFLDGKKSFWLIGSVVYTDMVGNALPYVTFFCYRVDLPFERLRVDGGDEYNRRT